MSPQLSPDFKGRVLLAAANSPSLTRKQAQWRAVSFSILAAIPMLSALYLAGGPEHASGRPFIVTVVLTLGCFILAIVATWLVSMKSRWMTNTPRTIALFLVLFLPILYSLWIAVFYGSFEPPFERLGIRCFILTLVSAPWPFAAMVTWRKTLELHRPGLLGAAFGAVSGTWAGLMVVLFCPLSEPGHVARGHLLPFAVLMMAGWCLGEKLFAVKST